MASFTSEKFIIPDGAVIGNTQKMQSSSLGVSDVTPAVSLSSTSIFSGGVITINAGNPALVDVSAGSGVVVDSADTSAPIVTSVSWAAIVGQILPDVVNDVFTSLAIDATGTLIFKQNAAFSHAEESLNIILGSALHPGIVVTSTAADVIPGYNVMHQVKDFAQALGPINIGNGLQILANGANLKLNMSAGTTFDFSANYPSDSLDPNNIVSAPESAFTMIYSYQDGVGGYNLTTVGVEDVDVLLYDDGTGTLATVSANRWSLQAVWFFPDSLLHIVEYGQSTYSSLAAAVLDIPPNSFLHNPVLGNGTLRAWMAVKKSATDMSDIGTNAIVPASRFNP
jgi:hypothetical protein